MRRRSARRTPVLLATALVFSVGPWPDVPGGPFGCARLVGQTSIDDGTTPYVPDRRDYASFQRAHSDLYEPNYLPFMVHRFAARDARGDLLIFCRWADADMPIEVAIVAPEIPESLQDEFRRIEPRVYVDSVRAALAEWEAALDGLVVFREVSSERDAELVIRVRGDRGPTLDERVQMLGSTVALTRACRIRAWDRDAQVVDLDFAVPELEIFVADEVGLLTDEQVRRIALHEIGHALGMRGHSPAAGDLMHRQLEDSERRERLSEQDVNSFLSLYTIPNGAMFAFVSPDEEGDDADAGAARPPTGGPQLALAPHVDSQLGFEIKLPRGWMRVAGPHGVFAANGPSWDYDASLEIFVWPAPTIGEFLARFRRALLAGTWLRHRARIVVAGRPALKLLVEGPDGRSEQILLIVELGDGRVMMVHFSCPVETAAEWTPYLDASLGSLEVWGEPGRPR